MKRPLMVTLILFMLGLMVFPVTVNAATTAPSTKTPFDWLNDEEQAYVTSLRAYIVVVQGRVKTAKANLGTMFLQEGETWYQTFSGELASINSGLDTMEALSAPAEFTGVAAQCKNLPDVSNMEAESLHFASSALALVEAAQMVGHIDGDLSAVDGALSGLLGSINSRIADVAKRREKAVDAVSALFDSCMERPARPY